jgi:hypothetical protein
MLKRPTHSGFHDLFLKSPMFFFVCLQSIHGLCSTPGESDIFYDVLHTDIEALDDNVS